MLIARIENIARRESCESRSRERSERLVFEECVVFRKHTNTYSRLGRYQTNIYIYIHIWTADTHNYHTSRREATKKRSPKPPPPHGHHVRRRRPEHTKKSRPRDPYEKPTNTASSVCRCIRDNRHTLWPKLLGFSCAQRSHNAFALLVPC